MTSVKTFFVILFTCTIQIIIGQEPVSIHLTEDEGLPDVEFYNIIEDQSGFIWLAADKGLFRYDGTEFVSFSNADKKGLSVFEPQIDALGRIWCNNISGQFFYVENDTLITCIDLGSELNGELAEFRIVNDRLLVFTRKQLIVVDIDSKKIIKRQYAALQFGSPLVNEKGILFGAGNYIASLSDTFEINKFTNLDLPNRKLNPEVNSYIKSQLFQFNRQLYFSENINGVNSFFRFSHKKNKFVKIEGLQSISQEKHLRFFENRNSLWVATSSGVYIFEENDSKLVKKQKFLNNAFVTNIIKDKDANIWLSTLTNGVFVIPNEFIKKLNIPLDHSNLSCLEKIDNSKLLFGTKLGDIGCYDILKNELEIIDLPSLARVSDIFYDSNSQNYIVSKDDGSFVLNKSFKPIFNDYDFSNAKSFSLKDEELIFANYAKVELLNYKTKYNLLKTISNRKRAYTTFYDDFKNYTYVSYVDGLCVYDANWNFSKITYNNKPIFVKSITKTAENTIYAASFKNGIYKVINNQVVENYTFNDGLLSNKVSKIIADNNLLWIATDKGIQQFNPQTKIFKSLTKRDGILSSAITGLEVFENDIVVSSNKGLFSINKTDVFKAELKPEIYFKAIEVNEKPQKINNTYTLDYNENAIKIVYNVNGFQYNQKARYQYRLLGYSDKWVTSNIGENTVKYTSLPAGNFEFQVRPYKKNELNNTAIKAITIVIKKPFWQQAWFVFMSALLTAASIAFFNKRKLKRKELEQQQNILALSQEKRLIMLKLENLRSQMNPHFIFNALNSIQEYIILNEKNLASDYLGKFADLIRKYLNHSSEGEITLKEEIDCLEMYLELEKLRFEDKLNYTINSIGSIAYNRILIPTMLIQPYVENALKHGLLHRKTNKKLDITFELKKQHKIINCIIQDNGIGRKKAELLKSKSFKNHQSFATKANQDRLNLLNYGKAKKIGVSITDLYNNDQPTGTKVEIEIPYNNLNTD